ncbi:MAG: hypothetical protein LBP85_04760 [Prevotellaceae bacterium]|jgi:hypothetical protein|nr:hypothetical protein [Prevotellaceae bacterium]
MKKNLTYSIIAVLFFCIGTNVFAQEKSNFLTKLLDKGFLMTMDFRMGTNPSFKKTKTFRTSDWIFGVGYNFNKYLSARIPVGIKEEAMFEEDGVRDWKQSETLGLCLGFKIDPRMELNVSAGSSISGDNDWKYTYYNAGINIQTNAKYCNGTLGFGFRFYDARKNIKNRNAVYLALGLRISK